MLENLPYFCLEYYAKIANFIRLKKKYKMKKQKKYLLSVFLYSNKIWQSLKQFFKCHFIKYKPLISEE